MRHDPQIKAVLTAFMWPILRATWAVDPTGCRKEVVGRVADNFGLPVMGLDEKQGPARRRGVQWTRHLRAAMAKQVFGHAVFERRYELAADGLYDLVSLGPRMPWTIAALKKDRAGVMQAVYQTTQDEPIAADRLVWYVNELEGSTWTGISGLRPAFGAWLLKQETWRVHATSIRRFGMGVPTVEAPAGATAQQVTEAQALASGMRVGDQTGVGLPTGYNFKLSGLVGSVPDALAFVKYLDQQISKMALAGIVDLGQTEIGSRALGETFLDLFLLALQGVADELAMETTTGYDGMPGAVLDLVNVNWGEDEPCPKIVCTDVGEQHEATAQALYYLLQYGAITSDPNLEAYIRQAWRLPQRDTPQPPPQPTGHPAPDVPPAPEADPKPPVPPAPAKAGRGSRSRAAFMAARRQPTKTEVAAGFDPAGHQADWQAAVDSLMSQWQPIFTAQRDSLVDQVTDAVDAGRLDKLGSLTASSDQGAGLLESAMANLAAKAVKAMTAEASAQGVTVDPAKVKVNGTELARTAEARAAQQAQYQAAQASQFALTVAVAGAGADAGGFVHDNMNELSARSLRDVLGAALTAAQNAGRMAVLEAAPASAGTASYVATEFLDDNTCFNCVGIDGTEFGSLAEAQAAYPTGGYIECQGYSRCRGTVMGVWGEVQ